jgi:hypothetical protein
MYYDGWDAPDRGHGHGIYAQNETGAKRIINNIICNEMSHGVHVYGSSAAYLNYFLVDGNTLFNNGSISSTSGFARNILLGGGRIAESPTVVDNYTYYTPDMGGSNDIGYHAGTHGLKLIGNYLAGGNPLNLVNATNATITGNAFLGTVSGFASSAYPDNSYAPTVPTSGVRSFARRNQYEPQTAYIAVFNWEKTNSAQVDISDLGLLPGRQYQLHSAEDYFGEGITSTINNSYITIPMTGWTVAAPVGYPAPPSTLPRFGVFVLVGKPVSEKDTLIGDKTAIP